MRILGRIKWFNEEKGFGFITTEQGDHFIHVKSLKNPQDKPQLLAGGCVAFLPVKHARGMQATDVEFVEVNGNV